MHGEQAYLIFLVGYLLVDIEQLQDKLQKDFFLLNFLFRSYNKLNQKSYYHKMVITIKIRLLHYLKKKYESIFSMILTVLDELEFDFIKQEPYVFFKNKVISSMEELSKCCEIFSLLKKNNSENSKNYRVLFNQINKYDTEYTDEMLEFLISKFVYNKFYLKLRNFLSAHARN